MSDANHEPTFQFSPDTCLVYQPRYVTADRSVIRAIVKKADGQLAEMEAKVGLNPPHPMVRDILLQYSEADLEHFTRIEAKQQEGKQRRDKRLAEDRASQAEKDMTFVAKTKALEMAEVAGCGDERILRKIRRARSAFEVSSWVSLALQKSLEKEGPLS